MVSYQSLIRQDRLSSFCNELAMVEYLISALLMDIREPHINIYLSTYSSQDISIYEPNNVAWQKLYSQLYQTAEWHCTYRRDLKSIVFIVAFISAGREERETRSGFDATRSRPRREGEQGQQQQEEGRHQQRGGDHHKEDQPGRTGADRTLNEARRLCCHSRQR